MALRALVVPVTPFQQNCSLIWCDKTMKGAFVDPGGDLEVLLQAADDNGVTLEKILVTHAHVDHAGGVATLARDKSLPIEGPHEEDKFWIDLLPDQSTKWGFPPAQAFAPNRWLDNQDAVTVGGETLTVRHCPGHTPGHVIFAHESNRVAFVGDVLFQGAIGRTDFPRGDHDTLIRSIRERLWPLGDDMAFVPGHGPLSTFGQERQTNPFVRDS